MNMKYLVRCNVKKTRDIKDSEKYIILNISLEFGSIDKMRITSSEPKYYFKISGKRLNNSLGIKHNVRSKKKKKARYNITNVSMKNILRIIKEF